MLDIAHDCAQTKFYKFLIFIGVFTKKVQEMNRYGGALL